MLSGHSVTTAQEQGWGQISNGKLLQAAAAAQFDVFITCDQNIHHQQNLKANPIAFVVLSTNNWRVVKRCAFLLSEALATAAKSGYCFVEMKVEKGIDQA